MTDQFNDLYEHPVVGGIGHQFKEDRGQGEVIPRVLACQLTDHAHRSTLNSYREEGKRTRTLNLELSLCLISLANIQLHDLHYGNWHVW